MSVTARIALAVTGKQQGVNDLGRRSFEFELREIIQFTPGTAAGQTNIVFADNRTIDASTNDDLDLNGVLPDALGGTINLISVKAIIIRAASGNTNNLVVGPAASNGFVGPFGAAAHTIAIRPGDEFVITCRTGWTVTPSTGDILRIANGGSGSTVSYDIIILGH